MNENVENLIRTQLREIRAEMGELRLDLGSLKADSNMRLDDLRNMIGGYSVMLSTLAGYIHGIEQRVEKPEPDRAI